MPVIRFAQLVGIGLDDEEQAAAIEEVASLYFDARDAGLDPVAGIETSPDGDTYVVEVDDDA